MQAQFWKKIFGKEEKRKNKKPKQEIPVKKEEKQEKKLKDKIAPQYPEAAKSESYRIDILHNPFPESWRRVHFFWCCQIRS